MSPCRAEARAEDARSALTRGPSRSYPWWSPSIRPQPTHTCFRRARYLRPATYETGSETGLEKLPLSKPPECNDVSSLSENALQPILANQQRSMSDLLVMLRHHRAVRHTPCATTRNPLKTACFEQQGRRQQRRDTLLDRAVQNIALPEVFSPGWIDLDTGWPVALAVSDHLPRPPHSPRPLPPTATRRDMLRRYAPRPPAFTAPSGTVLQCPLRARRDPPAVQASYRCGSRTAAGVAPASLRPPEPPRSSRDGSAALPRTPNRRPVSAQRTQYLFTG